MTEQNGSAYPSATMRKYVTMGTLGVVACGLCCAIPLLGWIGGATALAALGWLAEGAVAAALVAFSAFIGGLWYWRQRRQCRISQ